MGANNAPSGNFKVVGDDKPTIGKFRVVGDDTDNMPKKPRGVVNNNPGNIRRTDDQWWGASKEQDDEEFVSFETPEAGIRAMAKTINTYKKEYGLNTIEGIVSRWAPPNENDTESYIKSVSSSIGIERDKDLSDKDKVSLIKAMIQHENGDMPYSDRTIKKGIELAKDEMMDEYASMADGWYRDPDTGEKFEIKKGKRL